MQQNFKEHIINLLLQDDRLKDEQGELRGNLVKEYVNTLDEKLITLLLEDEQTRTKFFLKIKDVYVFKTNEFKFFLDENSIDNSFTQYSNRIGLASGGKFLKDNTDVILNFPFKDCILEGGQSTEDGLDTYFEYDEKQEDYIQKQSKRKEIFFNEVLARDEIDRLLEPKAFTNITKYDNKGKSTPKNFNRNAKGTITDNLIIKGNNLLALHSLKKEFKGKIKLIYIDPPYNTGNDSFAYNDNFNHSTWLTFMRNRLMVAKELLREDGFLLCHIDNNEGEYLKLILDDVFKRENHINTFYAKVRYADKTLKQDMDFHKEIETVFIFQNTNRSKPNLNEKEISNDKYIYYFNELTRGKEIILGNKKVVIFNRNEIEIIKKQPTVKGRKEIWATGSILDGNSSGRFFRDYLTGRYNIDGYGVVYKISDIGDEVNNYRYFTGPQKKGATKGKYFQGVPKKQIESINKTVSIPINNFYDLAGSFGNCRLEGGVELRSGKKPEELLKIIIHHFSNENDIVLDYHLGSGTTCAVAHKMNRQFIGCEQIDNQVNLSKTRLQNVIGKKTVIEKKQVKQPKLDLVAEESSDYFKLEYDPTGISKAVNWQGGGSFVYLELAKNNQTAKEEIQKCKSLKELMLYFETMYQKYFLHYNVRIKQFKEEISQEENFKKLTLNRQKEIFSKMLDLNQLYVNLSEIEDSKYNISKEDIALTKDFYQVKK